MTKAGVENNNFQISVVDGAAQIKKKNDDSQELEQQDQNQRLDSNVYYPQQFDMRLYQEWSGIETCSCCLTLNKFKHAAFMPVVYHRCVECNLQYCESCIDLVHHRLYICFACALRS